MQTQHMPSAGLHAKAYDAKENAMRNTIQPSGSSQGAAACRPSSAPSFGPADSPYIEHTRRDSRGVTTTRRYLKGQLLGKGGFAKCFKITDVETKKDWACKVVQKSSLTKQRHKVKLQTEIKIHKSLYHRHVVRFEDVFEDKENVYIIMELCSNQTLLEFVKRKKRLTESETRRYMLQMLDGVRFLHTSKVIHRDLKLGNLFLGFGDEIKIGDFGLACKLQFDGERKRTLCGTPNYIAPEVLEGKNGHSYEVDMWSIGVVMYTCLVGKPPFETNDVKSTYKLIKSNSYSFPERLHISEGAKSLIRRILQSEPESRPSIEQVLSDPWFLGEGMAIIHQAKAAPAGLSSTSSERSATLATSLSSAMGILSEGHRLPLQPIQDSQAGRHTDRDAPLSNKYPDSLSSRIGSTASDNAMSVLERNVTTSATSSHYTSASERLDSARGTSSGLSSGINLMRPSSASSAISSEKGAASSVPSFATGNFSSTGASEFLARRAAGSGGSSSNIYSGLSSLTAAASDRPLSAIPSGANNVESTTPTKRLSKQVENMDLQREASADTAARQADTKLAGMASSVVPIPAMASTVVPAPRTGDGEDQLSLQSMHSNIKSVLVHVQPSSSASSSKKDPPVSYLPLPLVWVSRWVDYSKKYGLGYKLSNGCSGVFFNDATKMLLETDGDSLEYIERMRREDGSKYDVRRKQSLKGHPADLTKKVTLMEHFKNYLDETHPNRDSPLHQPTPQAHSQEDSAVGVYVRKWMRTRHSIIFRLSNNNFQVNFFDDTEVLLWSDKPWVTYKGKNKQRNTYNIHDITSFQELSKRLKYTKDILSQLITTH